MRRLIAFMLAFWASISLATPLTDAETKGPIRWPNDTTITVYIPEDPDGLGRDKDLADGIKSWGDEAALKDRGIKIEVKTGTPPAGATNAVGVSWVDGQINGRYGEGGPSYESKDGKNTADGGSIKISRDKTEVTNGMAKNLGVHEMGHVLGLDDVKTAGAAMNPAFTKSDTVSIGATDRDELKATYAANGTDSKTETQGVVTPHDGVFDYRYTVTWLSGGPLGLFQVDVPLASLLSVQAPRGWEWLQDSPDSDIVLDPERFDAPEQFISFLIRDEVSYLGPQFPTLVFMLTSSAPPGTGQVYAAGRQTTTVPVPVPPVWGLLLIAALAAWWQRRLSHEAR